tara:strand:- start:507 stop:692 length:186 start_codon:yes stop_codon:yes gene_type:complete
MDLDDLEPQAQPVKLKDLTHWNIEDLELYIEKMEKEILRVRDMIEDKKKISVDANSLFKSS